MKRRLIQLLVLAVLLVAGLFAFAWSGSLSVICNSVLLKRAKLAVGSE